MEPGKTTVLSEIKNWLEDYAPADLIEKCAASIEQSRNAAIVKASQIAKQDLCRQLGIVAADEPLPPCPEDCGCLTRITKRNPE